jgi:phosphate/sulfate permease
MLKLIADVAIICWIISLLYEIISPKVEDPRALIGLSLITALAWEDLNIVVSVIVSIAGGLFALIVLYYYRQRWKDIGYRERKLREAKELREAITHHEQQEKTHII